MKTKQYGIIPKINIVVPRTIDSFTSSSDIKRINPIEFFILQMREPFYFNFLSFKTNAK